MQFIDGVSIRTLLGEIVGVIVSGRLSRKLDPELGTTRMELGAPAVVIDGIIESFIGALLHWVHQKVHL